jgi:predicted enzyme related to lactoylglutathione lyase
VNGVVGLRERSQHAVRHSPQVRAVRLELDPQATADVTAIARMPSSFGEAAQRSDTSESSLSKQPRQRRKRMIKLSTAQVWVRDQDEALEFYTRKVGWQVRSDLSMPQLGDFRWLTVGPADQPDISVVLMAIPGEPVMNEQTQQQVREVMSKGFAGTLFLTTDDAQAAFKELSGRGIEFAEKPEKRPYGIDMAFRDPSGNNIRVTQMSV